MWNIANIWKLGDSINLKKKLPESFFTARRGDEGGDVQRHGLQFCQYGRGCGFRDGPGDARSAWVCLPIWPLCGDGGHQIG